MKGPVVAFEVFLDAVPGQAASAGAPPGRRWRLTPFQPIERDFAFVMDDGVQAADVVGAARSVDRKLITDVRVFDVFSGGGLGDGKKSLAVNVILRPTDKTLTDADIEAIGAKIVAAVEKATGGALRT